MGWLLDTNVISHLSPSEKTPDATLVQWLKDHESDLWMSGITIFEVSQGIHKLIRNGATKRASDLKVWLDMVLSVYENKIIMPDINIFIKAGELAELAVAAGGDAGIEDAIIAATGHVNTIVVLTRNVKHLKLMQVEYHNPFESIPPT